MKNKTTTNTGWTDDETSSDQPLKCGGTYSASIELAFVHSPPNGYSEDWEKQAATEVPELADGCLAWQRNGLGEPAEVTQATNAYRAESDPLGEFFALRCSFHSDFRATRAEVRKAYEDFCNENGIRHPVDAKSFAARLRANGCDDGSVRRNGRVFDGWKGVKLLEDVNREARRVA